MLHNLRRIFHTSSRQPQVDAGMTMNTLDGVRNVFAKVIYSFGNAYSTRTPAPNFKLRCERIYPPHPLRPQSFDEILLLRRSLARAIPLESQTKSPVAQSRSSSPPRRSAAPSSSNSRRPKRHPMRQKIAGSTKLPCQAPADPNWAKHAYLRTYRYRERRPLKRVRIYAPEDDKKRETLKYLYNNVCNWIQPCLHLVQMHPLTNSHADILVGLHKFEYLLSRCRWEDIPHLRDHTVQLDEINTRLAEIHGMLNTPRKDYYAYTTWHSAISYELKECVQTLSQLL